MGYLGQIPDGRRAQDTAFRYRNAGQWVRVTWGQFDIHVGATIKLLKRAGIKKSDRIAIALPTSYAFVVVDWACAAIGAITVPMHTTSSREERLSILTRTSPKLVMIASGVMQWEEQVSKAGLTIPVWALDDATLPQDRLLQRIAKVQASDWSIGGEDDEVRTLVFTSGTTGEPRGVKITNGMIRAMVDGSLETMPVIADDCLYLFLPLAHIFGRMFLWSQAQAGFEIVLAPDYNRIQLDLQETSPTVMAAVPRLLEKMYDQIALAARTRGGLGELMWEGASQIAINRGQRRRVTYPLLNSVSRAVFDRTVYEKIRDAFGGNLRMLISGGAPLAPNLAAFFIGAGIPVLQGYGMTETTGAIFVNTIDDNDPRTVGHPIPGVEYRFGPENELWLRGPTITPGYWKDRKKLLDDDGWLHTGDCADVDDLGRLRITGRIKELLILGNGKNVAPVPIESKLNSSSLVERCVLIGDNLPYVTALISLDHQAVLQQLGVKTLPDFAHDPRVETLVSREIERINKRLGSHESIKAFRIVDGIFSVQGGELTTTMKIKRSAVAAKHKHLIVDMYPEALDQAESIYSSTMATTS